MIVFILMIVVQLKVTEGFQTDYLTKAYTDRTACEIAEGESVTAADANSDIVGWAVVHNCDKPVSIPKKA